LSIVLGDGGWGILYLATHKSDGVLSTGYFEHLAKFMTTAKWNAGVTEYVISSI